MMAFHNRESAGTHASRSVIEAVYHPLGGRETGQPNLIRETKLLGSNDYRATRWPTRTGAEMFEL